MVLSKVLYNSSLEIHSSNRLIQSSLIKGALGVPFSITHREGEQMLNLLMICTGNICRSPIAEGLAPIIGNELGLTVHTKSVGTLGLRERPADPKSVKVCSEVNVDISSHRSQGITQELVDWATYILVMERRHASHLEKALSTSR